MCNLVKNWIQDDMKGKEPNQARCYGDLHNYPSKISREKLEFLNYPGKVDPQDEYSTITKMPDNAVDISMKFSQVYNIELLLKISGMNPDYRKTKLPVHDLKLTTKSKEKSASKLLKLNYDYICKGRSCTLDNNFSNTDEVIFNISLELTNCPEEGINDPVYVVAYRDGQSNMLYPLGAMQLNIETICGCGCEKTCSAGYEKQHSFCRGGNRKCGACLECPDGSFGEFCQCNVDGSERPTSPLKGLPSVLIGEKDDLIQKTSKHSKTEMSFGHSIVPLNV